MGATPDADDGMDLTDSDMAGMADDALSLGLSAAPAPSAGSAARSSGARDHHPSSSTAAASSFALTPQAPRQHAPQILAMETPPPRQSGLWPIEGGDMMKKYRDFTTRLARELCIVCTVVGGRRMPAHAAGDKCPEEVDRCSKCQEKERYHYSKKCKNNEWAALEGSCYRCGLPPMIDGAWTHDGTSFACRPA